MKSTLTSDTHGFQKMDEYYEHIRVTQWFKNTLSMWIFSQNGIDTDLLDTTQEGNK